MGVIWDEGKMIKISKNKEILSLQKTKEYYPRKPEVKTHYMVFATSFVVGCE